MEVKTIVITGASDGIGACSARQLKVLGHNVIIVGRNKEKTEKIAKELDSPYHIADYSKLSDVINLARELNKYPKIDVLVNNAGCLLKQRTITEDGYEKTFQINFLAHFLLTKLLIHKLSESKALVIQTASLAANFFGQKFDIEDLENNNDFKPLKAYGESKLFSILFTKELNKRYKNINAVAFEPGIPRSNFASEALWFFKMAYHTPLKYLFTISTKRSSRRLLYLILNKSNKDYICGETYSYKKLYKVKYQNDEISNILWNKWEEKVENYNKL